MLSDDAPDIRVLWDKRPQARKPYVCARCGDAIEVGQKYASTGIVLDGTFEARKTHLYADYYPSGCPRLGEKDRAEIERDSAL